MQGNIQTAIADSRLCFVVGAVLGRAYWHVVYAVHPQHQSTWQIGPQFSRWNS